MRCILSNGQAAHCLSRLQEPWRSLSSLSIV